MSSYAFLQSLSSFCVYIERSFRSRKSRATLLRRPLLVRLRFRPLGGSRTCRAVCRGSVSHRVDLKTNTHFTASRLEEDEEEDDLIAICPTYCVDISVRSLSLGVKQKGRSASELHTRVCTLCVCTHTVSE